MAEVTTIAVPDTLENQTPSHRDARVEYFELTQILLVHVIRATSSSGRARNFILFRCECTIAALSKRQIGKQV